jgi:Mg2+ and Co2+ transporter CorA
MLSAFIPQPQGLARFELRAGAAIPGEAIWLDLIEPTPSEERQVESFLSIDVPTRDEMREIEASNRLYEEDGGLYMTATVVTKLDSDLPESTQITFILSGTKLVTNRYVDPLPFRRFIAYAERHPNSCNSPPSVLAGLLESVINRVADVIERVATDLDGASVEVFSASRKKRAPSATFARHSSGSVRTASSYQGAREPRQPGAPADLRAAEHRGTHVTGRAGSLPNPDPRRAGHERSRLVPQFQGVVHPRCHAGAHQHRPEQHPQDLLGRDGGPAAAVGDRGRFRHEFLENALAARDLGFWAAMGVMLVTAIGPFLFFKRKGWL